MRQPRAPGGPGPSPPGRRALVEGAAPDRLRYGLVTDFIVLKIGHHPWPAFNLADAALCAGVGLFGLH